jgi:selT/selW/selH-like putative selenoprotein
VQPELVPGGRGVFDVAVDGRVIFSKHASHRFPETGEIIHALRSGRPPTR